MSRLQPYLAFQASRLGLPRGIAHTAQVGLLVCWPEAERE